MSEKLPSPKERWIDRGDGSLHLLDASGSVIAIQKPQKNGSRRVQDKRTHTFMLDKDGRRVWVPKGTDLDEAPYPPHEKTWEFVCEMIAEGKTLTSIGAMPEMPPTRVLRRWKDMNPEFKALYLAARRDRAEVRADQLMEIADKEGVTEEDVPFQRLRKDVLEWGARMDAPADYGKAAGNEGGGGVTIIIQTGVPEPLTIEVKKTSENEGKNAT